MLRFSALLVVILAVVIGTPAHAADEANESLEWLLTSRPNIAIEVVTDTIPVVSPDAQAAPVDVFGKPKTAEVKQLTIQTRLVEALKGQPPQQASFVRRWQSGEKPGLSDAARPENGTKYLLFFDDHGQVTNAINLKFPSRKMGVGADVRDVAIASDFTILKSGEVIEDMVRRRLAQFPKNAVPDTANAPSPSKKVNVPINSPAWNVLCDVGSCDLVVPDDSLNKNIISTETPKLRVAEFTGPAYVAECNYLPKSAFEIKSIVGGQPHTLSITCSRYPKSPPDPRKMTITFKVLDVKRAADYDFQWDIDPDKPLSRVGFFTDRQLDCETMARTFQFRLQGQVPFVSKDGAPDDGPPMVATWKADCVPSDRWGYVIMFELNVRHAVNGENVAAPEATTSASTPATPAAPKSATAPVPASPLLAPAK